MPKKAASSKKSTITKKTSAVSSSKKAVSSAKKTAKAKTPKKAATPVKKTAEPKKAAKPAKKNEVSEKKSSSQPVSSPKSTAKAESEVSDKNMPPLPSDDENEVDELFGSLNDAPREKADIYDELIAKQMEREIIRTQRKQMAGKDSSKKGHGKGAPAAVGPVTDRVIEIPEAISVKEFSEKTGIGAAKVIGELMKNGILANINQQVDYDTASIIAEDCGVQVKKKISEASAEDVFRGDLQTLLKEDSEDLETRPPIVVVMGHVDHGKTSLLDCIRETDVVAKESGGITQHIGAYQVEKNGRKITFLDTPGHEAFTAMRARGAKVTDIAILVVAADEGIKPQTIEALQHAQEAAVPIIVAINKIDKEGAQPDRVKGELGEYDLVPEDWGGKTIMVPVSALTGEGIPTLLDMILLTADLENLKANPHRSAVGTVVEAHLDPSLGPVATVIVNTGTLKIMDNIVIGGTHGRVKVMKDYLGKNVKKAGPSMPVLIAGLAATPHSGDIFQAVSDEKTARGRAQTVQTLQQAELIAKRGVGEIISQIGSGQLKQLKLVLKADAKGSLEALKQSLMDIKHDDVGVKIILSGVGAITESDVMMAAAAGGIVMGFHTQMNLNVRRVAEREGVEVLQYTIIYKLIEDIKKILTGLLEPEIIETILGRAEVKQVFMTEKKQMIVGCKVISGHVEKTKVRVFRDNELAGEGQIASLKKVEKTVHEVAEGNDCGILYNGFMPLKEGDILESYKMEKRVRTL